MKGREVPESIRRLRRARKMDERGVGQMFWGAADGFFGPRGLWAQVAERLMAADCKSAAPWSYGGSNPPLCTMKAGIREPGLGNSEECRQGFGSEVLGGSRNVCGFGNAGLADDGRWFGARVWQACGVEADSTDCDWRDGVKNGFSPACGEDSQGWGERQLVVL